MAAPQARGFLLMRRAGNVWGIANGSVEGLARDGAGYRIAAGGESLAADEILGVVEDLRVWPPAPALRRFWAEEPLGLAVHGGMPVVVVDPRRSPAVLRCEAPRRDDAGDDVGEDDEGHD